MATKKEKFLIEFPQTGCNVAQTCKKLGIASKTEYYRWLESDPEFKEKIEKMRNDYNDTELKNADVVEIINWCESMGNRMTTNTWELNRVINWYKIIFGKEPDNRECMGCLVSVVRALQMWSKEHKSEYIK